MYTVNVPDVDNDVAHYMAGVVPRAGVTLEEAAPLLFRRGAVSVRFPNSAYTPTVEACFANKVKLLGVVDKGKITACSVTTEHVVYLAGTLEAALRYTLNPAKILDMDL